MFFVLLLVEKYHQILIKLSLLQHQFSSSPFFWPHSPSFSLLFALSVVLSAACSSSFVTAERILAWFLNTKLHYKVKVVFRAYLHREYSLQFTKIPMMVILVKLVKWWMVKSSSSCCKSLRHLSTLIWKVLRSDVDSPCLIFDLNGLAIYHGVPRDFC